MPTKVETDVLLISCTITTYTHHSTYLSGRKRKCRVYTQPFNLLRTEDRESKRKKKWRKNFPAMELCAQVTNVGSGLQRGANILHKQSYTDDKRWSSSLVAGQGLELPA